MVIAIAVAWKEQDISRVLFFDCKSNQRTVIYLGRLLPDASSGHAEMPCIPARTGKRPTIVPPALLPTGVYRASTSRCCWCALTAPLHPCQVPGGMFLWHYPHDRSHWPLASKFGLSEARTFLGLNLEPATVSPTLPTFSVVKIRAKNAEGRRRKGNREYGLQSREHGADKSKIQNPKS